MRNLVSNTGVIATDSSGAGSGRWAINASPYGGDKAIFGFGRLVSGILTYVSMTNLVSNTGVVSSDTPGVGSGRGSLGSCGYSSS
jgi:hypothetical protein